MRITHHYQARVFSANNQASMARIAELQEQISSAKRVLDPADDPKSASKSVLLQQSLGQVEQYHRNNTYVESRLGMEESAMAAISNVITAVRELALQANNDAMGDADRQALLHGITSRVDELRALANSKGPNGEYLFSGTERLVRPYPDPLTNQYDGNDSIQMVNIGFDNQIALGTSGNQLLNYEINGGTKDVFSTISDLQIALGTPVTVAGRAVFHDQMAVVLEELDAAQNQVLTQRASVGDRLARVETARDNNSAVELLIKEELNTNEGLDFADAISRMEAEIQTLEAIQSTYSRFKDLSLFKYL
ncbi:MAG: flagellar hook-associated protein FlgL [Pseudomonadota bacterium]